MKKIAITGLGFITSIGNDKNQVLDSLINLKCGIGLHPEFTDEKCPVKCAGIIKDFSTQGIDPEDWTYPSKYAVKREVLRGFSPHVLYAYCSTMQAIEDANLSLEDVANDTSTGMYTASSGSTTFLYNHMQRMDKVGVMRCHPMGVVSSVVGTLSYNLVSSFKITGASCGFASACASSSHALGFACDEISMGRQKRMIIVGGEDGDYRTILPFAGMRALSHSKDPNTASRPFDKNRDGFVGTAGATTMIIEDEETALARGAKIYGYILSWGQASDGYNVAIPHPEGIGLINAINNAFESANIKADDVDYINAHATSTPIGDVAELKAIKKVFGENSKVAISSTKAITGHGLSLTGIMEASFCALAMKEGLSIGSANISDLDDEAKSLNIIQKTEKTDPKIMLSLSSGFGGANTCIVFGK